MDYNMTIKLLPIEMPDRIPVEGAPGKKQDGFKPDAGIPVEELSEKDAENYGNLLKDTFMEHWKQAQALR